MLESFFEGMLILVLLVAGLVIAIQIGQRAGCKARAAGIDLTKGTGTVEGGVLGLLGLILAFTFFNQETRFEQRINLIVDQVNAMATAYDQTLRLPEPARGEIRALLRSYKDAYRQAFHTRNFDEQDDPVRQRGVELYRQIWVKANAACEDVDPEYCSNLLLPSIIELEKVAMAMLVARQTHSPWAVMALVWVLSACGAALAGYSMAAHKPAHMLVHKGAYLLALGATYYTIVDLEYPRWGLVTINPAVRVAVEELGRRMM